MKRIAGFMIVTSLAPMHAGVTITCNLLDTRFVQPPVGQFAVCDGVSKEGSHRMQISLVDMSCAYFHAKVDNKKPIYVHLPPEDERAYVWHETGGRRMA